MNIDSRTGFLPLCISLVEPLLNPVSGLRTREGGRVVHRLVYLVDTNAEGKGSWRPFRGAVVATVKPWENSPSELQDRGVLFDSLRDFISASPDLMMEIETYKFPLGATRPIMLEYLEDHMHAITRKNLQYVPKIQEIMLEKIQERCVKVPERKIPTMASLRTFRVGESAEGEPTHQYYSGHRGSSHRGSELVMTNAAEDQPSAHQSTQAAQRTRS